MSINKRINQTGLKLDVDAFQLFFGNKLKRGTGSGYKLSTIILNVPSPLLITPSYPPPGYPQALAR